MLNLWAGAFFAVNGLIIFAYETCNYKHKVKQYCETDVIVWDTVADAFDDPRLVVHKIKRRY